MEKLARKKSEDPIQEALREHKSRWNVAAKEFIARVIAFKRAINGRGDVKYGLPPNNIKDPLPQELVSFLSELSGNYTSLVDEASKIIQEQQYYSEHRKKPAEQKIATASSKTGKVQIGEHILNAELAITSEEQQRGLMFETKPKVMGFVYNRPEIVRIWMSNTPNPLDIVFSLNGQITNICRGEPYSTKLIGNWELSDLIVEMPAGTCQQMGIAVGCPIKLIK